MVAIDLIVVLKKVSVYRAETDTDIENRCVDVGHGGMNWGISNDMYIRYHM